MKKLFFLAVAVLFISGCKDNYGACVKAGYDIASGISTAMQSVDLAEQAGYLTAPEERNVVGYLEFANQADKVFISCAETVHTSKSAASSYTGCAQQFESTLNNPANLALIKVGNATQQQNITMVVNTMLKAVGDLIAGLGGK